jgi:hypothetical protein
MTSGSEILNPRGQAKAAKPAQSSDWCQRNTALQCFQYLILLAHVSSVCLFLRVATLLEFVKKILCHFLLLPLSPLGPDCRIGIGTDGPDPTDDHDPEKNLNNQLH